jgi:hypothetical protein
LSLFKDDFSSLSKTSSAQFRVLFHGKSHHFFLLFVTPGNSRQSEEPGHDLARQPRGADPIQPFRQPTEPADRDYLLFGASWITAARPLYPIANRLLTACFSEEFCPAGQTVAPSAGMG